MLEGRLLKDSGLYEAYSDFMRDYLNFGHISLVPWDECNKTNAHYVPHHHVVKLNSLTTKLRVVFDASAKSSNGLSLNNILFIGSKLQTNIFVVVLRFPMFLSEFVCGVHYTCHCRN